MHLLVEDRRDKERRSAVPEEERESTDMHVWSSEGEKAAREGKGERERERVNIGRTRGRPPYTGRQAVRGSVHLRVLGRWLGGAIERFEM